jgi:hypothetical protein
LDLFLTHIRARCPALTYLSMLKNAACPNFFTGKPSEDYRRYRHHVLSFFPNLRFLDASPVTDQERAAAHAAANPHAPAANAASPNSRHLANSAPASHLNSSASPKSRAAVAIGSSPADALVGRAAAASAGDHSDSDSDANSDNEHYEIAPEKGLDRMPQRGQNDLHAAFGVSTYTYVGKASEGNRFISNNEL